MANSPLEKFLVALLSSALGIFLFYYFKRKSQFTLPKESRKGIHGLYPIAAFAFYFLFVFLSIKIAPPLFDKRPEEIITTIGLIEAFRLSFLALIYAIILIKSADMIRQTIWGSTVAALWDDVKRALVCFITVLPISHAIYLFLDLAIRYLFQIDELPEQIVVKMIKAALPYPKVIVLYSVITVVLAPIVEEMLFRGFLQSWLRSFLSPKIAIAFSSLFFTIVHYSVAQGLGNIPILGSIFILACFLGFIYEKQKSLASAIILHALFNGGNLISILLIE
jgi:uncharacterized protein